MASSLDKLYTSHILDAINRIKRYVKGIDWELFEQDDKTQSAVIRQLEIIGEASKRLSIELKAKIDLPWRQIGGMRDKLIHHYIEIEMKEIWATIEKDLDRLETELKKQNNRPV